MIKNEPSDSGSKKVPDQKNPPARKKRRRPASRHKNRSGGEVTPRPDRHRSERKKPSDNSGSRTGSKAVPAAGAAQRSDRDETLSGNLSVHHKGFGFVLVPGGDDLFIPLESIGEARDGDLVLARVVSRPKGRNPIGRIEKIEVPSDRPVVGLVKREKDGKLVLVPEDGPGKTLVISKPGKARAGQVVVMDRQGNVTEVLGKSGDPGLDVSIIARNRKLPGTFPGDVEKESAVLRHPDFRKLRRKRLDLRKELIVTIDPASAEDFDDAISVKQLDSGLFELGVHIADVSHFVRESTALDKEARDRGTSIYFVNRVIPMLPEKLANDLCSLKPNVDRPAYSVIMTLDSRGDVIAYRIAETIIRSKRRYTYEEAENVINGAADAHAKQIHLLHALSLLLRRRREESGSIDFDISVPQITLDERGVPREIRPSQRLDAHRLVEECMLAANRVVASHVSRSGSPPFIYRVHDQPEIRDSQALLNLLKTYGIDYRMPAGELESEDYRRLLGIIENMEYRDLVQSVALRSMTKAEYRSENQGHFGLAFDAYTHFTSPIRRYPDLMIHRLLKRYAAAGMSMEGSLEKSAEKPRKFRGDRRILPDLDTICAQSTRLEIRATEAEREFVRIKSMEFLKNRIGTKASGVVSGVTSFGLFVQLKDYLIDGLIHISNLPGGSWEFDEQLYQLTAKDSGRSFRLGDPVEVKISSVSVEEQKADFLPA
jgi:ribonuclease R